MICSNVGAISARHPPSRSLYFGSAFTGVTEGYAKEILKDVEHAKWHMPSGAAKLEKAAELIADMEATKEAAVKPEAGKDPVTDEGTEPAAPESVTEADPDGGSVEGE